MSWYLTFLLSSLCSQVDGGCDDDGGGGGGSGGWWWRTLRCTMGGAP